MSSYFKSNQAILNEARDYLDGLVLGDGHIRCETIITGSYSQGCEYKNWLDKISEDLYEYGIESKVSNGQLRTGGFCPEGGSIAYHLWTRSYVEFREMHDRWYKPWYEVDKHPKRNWHKDENGEYFIWQKVVPKDICLSPICLANEYFGDGSTYNIYKYGYSYRTILSTDGFLKEDTIYLADLLSEVLDIKCNVNKAGKIGIYTQSDINIFLNYIKEYKVDCYNDKFPKELINS